MRAKTPISHARAYKGSISRDRVTYTRALRVPSTSFGQISRLVAPEFERMQTHADDTLILRILSLEDIYYAEQKKKSLAGSKCVRAL